jgi:hypothetical protein
MYSPARLSPSAWRRAEGSASRASAQQKIKQADAKYQDHPNGTQKCDGCIQFQAPNACKIVDGTISPDGWCQFFGAKSS